MDYFRADHEVYHPRRHGRYHRHLRRRRVGPYRRRARRFIKILPVQVSSGTSQLLWYICLSKTALQLARL